MSAGAAATVVPSSRHASGTPVRRAAPCFLFVRTHEHTRTFILLVSVHGRSLCSVSVPGVRRGRRRRWRRQCLLASSSAASHPAAKAVHAVGIPSVVIVVVVVVVKVVRARRQRRRRRRRRWRRRARHFPLPLSLSQRRIHLGKPARIRARTTSKKKKRCAGFQRSRNSRAARRRPRAPRSRTRCNHALHHHAPATRPQRTRRPLGERSDGAADFRRSNVRMKLRSTRVT